MLKVWLGERSHRLGFKLMKYCSVSSNWHRQCVAEPNSFEVLKLLGCQLMVCSVLSVSAHLLCRDIFLQDVYSSRRMLLAHVLHDLDNNFSDTDTYHWYWLRLLLLISCDRVTCGSCWRMRKPPSRASTYKATCSAHCSNFAPSPRPDERRRTRKSRTRWRGGGINTLGFLFGLGVRCPPWCITI